MAWPLPQEELTAKPKITSFIATPPKLFRRGDPRRLAAPEQLLDVAFESDGTVSRGMPGQRMLARPGR
jgi:hypothetical protein